MLQYLTDRMYDEVRGPGQFRPREDRGHFFLKLLLYKQNFRVLYSILFQKTSLFLYLSCTCIGRGPHFWFAVVLPHYLQTAGVTSVSTTALYLGMTYGVSMSLSLTEGRITLGLTRFSSSWCNYSVSMTALYLGLTYGVSMSLSLTEGRITLGLTRSSRLLV
jgi:hypothetical protein